MNRENTNKIHAIAYSILGVILVTVSVIAISQYNEKKHYKNELNNRYSAAFYDVTEFVDEIETNLRKGMLASSPAQLAKISGDIYRLSNAAKSSLGELPLMEIELDKTSRFLSQVGDYTYVLSQNAINGAKISSEQYKDIEALTEYATKLNKALSKTREGIEDGSVVLIAAKPGNSVAHAAGDILADLENVESSFSEYPSLIYDGPFSEHIENRKSPMLTTSGEITVDEARKKAADFLQTSPETLIFESDTQNSTIDAYNFYIEGKHRTTISISKRGGYVVYFLKNKNVDEEKLSFEEAIKKGSEFLEKHGFYSMKESYYDKSYKIATINYAYVQNGVKCYSDLVKVKVALDNGEILGFETGGYLMNHTKREIKTPSISEEEARKKLSPHLNFQSVSTAIIPKDSLEEIMCYEFHGSSAGRNFIIYINCENGREEKILMLIESENGILTV